MANLTDVCTMIVSLSARRELPGEWAGFDCDPAFVWTPEDLLGQLQAQFTDDDLLGARVMLRSADGNLELNPVLHFGAGPIMAVRMREEADPMELLGGGRVMGRLPPCLVGLLDYRLPEWTEYSDLKIFVAGSEQELAILWSCGLPATIATGLDQLQGRHVEQLITRLRMIAAPEADEDCPFTASLVLANWSIDGVHCGDQPWVQNVSTFLTGIDDCLEKKIYGGVWKPDDESFRRIRFCLQARLLEALGRHLLRSSAGTGWERHRERPPSGYSEAVQRLLRCATDEEYKGQYGETYKDFVQSLEEKLIGPLLQEAADTPEPETRNLRAMLADLSREFHVKSTSQASKYYGQSLPRRSGGQAETNPEADKHLVMLADRILAISQELQCKKPSRRKK